MYISLEWINELVNLKKLKIEELIEKLTLGGFEVEEKLVFEVNKQLKTSLDISATANRADSLSIKGIAKEIKALTKQKEPKLKYTAKNSDYEIALEKVLCSEHSSLTCSNFIGITVENLTNISSPTWLKEKLICSSIEPQNNLLDFQSYILLENGYPVEFYDLDKIQKKTNRKKFNLTLKPGMLNETFEASNNIEYKLNPEILVLKADDQPLSIGGIISNKNFCYSDVTTSLLIEASIFNSKKIRQQSRAIGLRTERSARYEKGLDSSSFINTLIRLVLLLKSSNPQSIFKIHTGSQFEKLKPFSIHLEYKNIIEILGPTIIKNSSETKNLKLTQIDEYLKRLEFDFEFDNNNLSWSVKIPVSRMDDLEREIDLIEEIGRLHGFNNFITSLPNISQVGKEDFSYQIRKKLTNCFLNEGLNELVQYSLVNDPNLKSIKLINPLILDCSTLRRSLLPNLIHLVSENSKQGNGTLEGFEYGHTFSTNNKGKAEYNEKEVVSGIFGGLKTKRDWNDSLKSLSWFEAKGKMDNLFKKLNLKVNWKNTKRNLYKNTLHPYRTADLYINDKVYLGTFGQINPLSSYKNNISKDIFLFEFELETLKNEFKKQKLPIYQPYSLYPKITKDLSFIVDKKVHFNQIQNTIFKIETEYLKNIELVDKYDGNPIPNHQISLCIQLTFQSLEKTLLTKEIEKNIENIQKILIEEYNIKIRL
jgi:phenylalanyl-tRNA synthetase beta chain